MGLNILRLSMCIQPSRLARGPVRIHLLLVKHLDLLGVLHVDRRVIVLSLLLALAIVVARRVGLLLSAIMRLVTHPLRPIEVLRILRLLSCTSGLFVDRLRRVLRALALVPIHAIVDHGVVVAFSLPVLDRWSHRHRR